MKIQSLISYFNERFPVINMALFVILFFMVRAMAIYFNEITTVYGIAWHALGIIAVISFFFRLRVFDEIKDFKIDTINFPNRVLQSGKVKLPQLIAISIAGTIIEIVWCLWTGNTALIVWSLAMGYSLLMRYEFFIAAFLKRYLLLYAVSHMLVMPLIILWVYVSFSDYFENLYPYYLLAGLSLLSGFSFEIARKIYAPIAEKPSVDSYSKSIGYLGSILLLLLILALGVSLQLIILSEIDARIWTYVIIGLIYLVALLYYLKNIKSPKEKNLRTAEKIVSLFMLASYVSIIIEIHSPNL